MFALTRAIVRAFLADRVATILTFAAPVAFFTLFALFYKNLESRDGFKFDIAIVDRAQNEDSRALVAALKSGSLDHLRIYEVQDADHPPSNALALVQIPPEFSHLAPKVAMQAETSLPGASDAAVQLVQLAVVRAFSTDSPRVEVTPDLRAGMLLRGSAAGIALIFVLFSASSIAGRGLGDDAAGLLERLRSLGVSNGRIVLARVGAMTLIACGQLVLTFLWAAAVFDVVPSNVCALAVAIGLGAAACTSFVALVANAVGNRSRFAAISPVVILVVSALSGSMIPRVLLPDMAARAGSWSFPAWTIDACGAAIEGRWAFASLGMLAAFVFVCVIGAAACMRVGGR